MNDFNVIRCQDRPTWLRERRRFVGASDSPVLLEQSSWGSLYSLWLDKVEDFEDEGPSSEWQDLGHELESTVARVFSERTKLDLVDPGDFTIVSSRTYPNLACTPDRVTADDTGIAPVQIKTVGGYRSHLWRGDTPPLEYQIQVQHEMAVLGARSGYLVALVGSPAFGVQIHRLRRHPGIVRTIERRAEEFMRWVREEWFPPELVDDSEATRKAIARRARTVDYGETVELPPEFEELDARRTEIKKLKKDLERECDGIENRIRHFLTGFDTATLNGRPLFRMSAGKRPRLLRITAKGEGTDD